jgi:DNA-directed RNA polymerase subunit RPC12/RpoP
MTSEAAKAITCPACGSRVFAGEWRFQGRQRHLIYAETAYVWVCEDEVEHGEYGTSIRCNDCGAELPADLAEALRSAAAVWYEP